MSLPSLGAWIEDRTRTSTGGLGESRSLRWERGLKTVCTLFIRVIVMSLPSLGAWIEETLIG